MDVSLAGRVALVTGGGSGIGLATARAFAEAGARVAILDRSEAAAKLATEAVGDQGGEAMALVADAGEAGEVDSAIGTLTTTWGQLDVLFNNAGIEVPGTVTEVTEDDWDACFRTNVKGIFLCSRAAQHHLVKTGGAIVNTASAVALVGVPGYAAYSAAKGAVVALTRAMAVDLAPLGVRVNAICPGLVRTPMGEGLLRRRGGGDLAAGEALTLPKYPLGRLANPDDIASMALFLASDASSFMTGTVIPVDGGMTAS